jgi:hypothetical protein
VVVCHESNILTTSRCERVAATVNVMLCEPDRCVLCRQFANNGSIISTIGPRVTPDPRGIRMEDLVCIDDEFCQLLVPRQQQQQHHHSHILLFIYRQIVLIGSYDV